MKSVIALLAFVIVFSKTLFAQYLSSGLVAHFTFDGNALDVTGNGNDGTVVGPLTLTADRFGNANGAYSFDRNGYISLSNNLLLNGATSAAITGWVRNRMEPNEGGFVVAAGDVRSGLDPFAVKFHGEIFAEAIFTETTRGDSAPNRYVGLTGGMAGDLKDQWVPFVSQFSSSSGETLFQLFINGALARETTYSYSLAVVFDQAMPVQIGALAGFGDTYFRGDIDELRFYNRALNAGEVSALAGIPEPGTYATMAGFVGLGAAFWKRRRGQRNC